MKTRPPHPASKLLQGCSMQCHWEVGATRRGTVRGMAEGTPGVLPDRASHQALPAPSVRSSMGGKGRVSTPALTLPEPGFKCTLGLLHPSHPAPSLHRGAGQSGGQGGLCAGPWGGCRVPAWFVLVHTQLPGGGRRGLEFGREGGLCWYM